MTIQELTAEVRPKDKALRKLVHQYNNFLTVVTNRTEFALLVDEKKEMKAALEEILSSSLDLEKMIQSLRKTLFSESDFTDSTTGIAP